MYEQRDNDMATEATEFLREDGVLGPVVTEYGPLRLEPADDLYERLVISILRQQVSMASAAAIQERLFEAVDVTPEGILAATQETFRDAGLSQQKVRYLRGAAEVFLERGYSTEYFAGYSDQEITTALTDITGVGPWTARMQLLFTFGRPDVFPVGDLGVRKGMATLFDLEDEDRMKMVELAERWEPYRSYATLYLWRVNEDITESVSEVDSG